MDEQIIEKIERLVRPLCNEVHVDLVDLNVKRKNKTIAVQVLTDRPSGGITIDECTWINRKLHHQLEEQHIVGDDFTLEVSSPGVDYPLRTEADFHRVIGRDVRVHLSEEVEGKVEYSGTVVQSENEKLILKIKDKELTIPIETVHKGMQII